MFKMLTKLFSSVRGWYPLIRESYSGAWQKNVVVEEENTLKFFAVYSCITLIAQDVAKLRVKLMQRANGIWSEAAHAAFSPLLRRPNHFQTWQKFMEQWVISELVAGNTYVLKVRDNRGMVTAMYVLDPYRTRPLVAPNGMVFYQVRADNLAGLQEDSISLPASEIIHDTMVCLFHPLVGVSPLYAGGLAATQGLAIQNNSAKFFDNYSQPGGMLTAPGEINDETAKRLKDHWEANYTGENAGRIAVLGDGLRYEQMMMTASDAQLIEQLKWTAENVCSVFHVPPYKIGVGAMPSYQNAEVHNQVYYSDCLQSLIESVEALLDEGLGLTAAGYGIEFNLEDLMKMDTPTKVKAAGDMIGAGFLSPNEARTKFNLPAVPGGESPYLQQQNYSLAALAARDATNPLAVKPPEPSEPKEPTKEHLDELESIIEVLMRKELAHVLH